MPRVLLVGGHGYLGSAVADLLAPDPTYELITVSRDGTSRHGRLSIPFTTLPSLFPGDRDEQSVLVWMLAGDRHHEDQHLARLLDVLFNTERIRMVYVSSCAVYGHAEVVCDESTPPQPLNAYAAVKARCEQIVTASPLASCVLRLATIHGHPGAGELKQSVHRLLHQAAQGAVHVYAPTNWRPFIQRDEAARAVDRAIRGPRLTGIYNLVYDHATFGTVAGYAAGLFGAQLHVDHSRADPRSYRVTSDKALGAGLLSPEPLQDLWTSMAGYAIRLRELRSQD